MGLLSHVYGISQSELSRYLLSVKVCSEERSIMRIFDSWDSSAP